MKHNSESSCLLALAAIAIGLVLPAYSKVVAKVAERGVELSWLGHVGVFGLLAVVALVIFTVFLGMAIALLGLLSWASDRVTRRSDKNA